MSACLFMYDADSFDKLSLGEIDDLVQQWKVIEDDFRGSAIDPYDMSNKFKVDQYQGAEWNLVSAFWYLRGARRGH